MKHHEPVSKIMSSDLKTVHVGQALSEARRLLAAHPFGHVPVVSGNKLVGMLSTTDIMKLTFDAGNSDPRATDAVLDNEFSIEGVMTKTLVTIRPIDTVRRAAELLVEGDHHALPVVEDEDKLVGIVTTTDLIKYLLDQY
jgi:CBS domain-containing protein